MSCWFLCGYHIFKLPFLLPSVVLVLMESIGSIVWPCVWVSTYVRVSIVQLHPLLLFCYCSSILHVHVCTCMGSLTVGMHVHGVCTYPLAINPFKLIAGKRVCVYVCTVVWCFMYMYLHTYCWKQFVLGALWVLFGGWLDMTRYK